jgi:hypothetical protein
MILTTLGIVMCLPEISLGGEPSDAGNICVKTFSSSYVCAPAGGTLIDEMEPICGAGQCVQWRFTWTCSRVKGGLPWKP